MDGINALIATGGGYKPPAFDLQTAQGNALQNQIMQQQIQSQPQRMQMQEQEMRLKELALDVRTKALNAKGKVTLDYPAFTIDGDADAVAEVADAVAQYSGEAIDSQVWQSKILPWAAQKGVTVRAREAKEAKVSPYGPEALSFAERKAQIEAKYREPKAPPEQKSKTEDQRIEAALTEELGRPPTNREILNEKARLTSETPVKPRALPAERAQELADMKRTHNQLETVAGKAEKIKDKFGPIEGRYNQLKVKFKADGPTQEVINELESLVTIAYGLSGKQITVQEMELLKKAILPRLEQPYGNFVSTLAFAKKWLEDSHNERLDYFKKSNYKTDIEPLGKKGNTVGRFKVEVE